MRILALNWQDLKNPQAGGAEVHLEEILKRLVQYGHQVDLLCSNFPGGPGPTLQTAYRSIGAVRDSILIGSRRSP